MQDKQNKGIGQYKDRPGYFMGGMIGGAILGALVNKIQGKDWKRGALWGGVGGGIGSALGTKFAPTGAGKNASWWQKMLYKPVSEEALMRGGAWDPRFKGLNILGQNISPVALAGAAAATELAGDPKKDLSDYEDWVAEQEAKRREKQKAAYKYWHWNPWATGGIVSARKGFYNGGGAWSDVAGEEEILGSGQDKIMSITGQEGIESLGGLEDISETFDVSETGSGIEAYHKLLADKYRPWLEDMDIDTTGMEDFEVIEIYDELASKYAHSAQGGYKKRPQYRDAGPVDRGLTFEETVKDKIAMIYNHPKVKARGERMLEEIEMMGLTQGDPETVNRKADYMLSQLNIDSDEITQSQRAEEMLTKSQRGDYLDMLQQVDPSNARFNPMASRNPMAYRAEGGIADLDMTGGGASFGPGTGTSDDIPAMLSDGEFVVTAKAVENLGGGDRMLGARKMYQMMNQLDPASQTPAEMNTVGMT